MIFSISFKRICDKHVFFSYDKSYPKGKYDKQKVNYHVTNSFKNYHKISIKVDHLIQVVQTRICRYLSYSLYVHCSQIILYS